MSKTDRYYKGSNHGGIIETPMGFTASTATNSRAFKTYAAADKWLRKMGYVPTENYTGEEPLTDKVVKKVKKSPKIKGSSDEFWALTEVNNARRTSEVIDYSWKKEPLLARAVAKFVDEADSEMMDAYYQAKNDEDLFKSAGYISKDKNLWTLEINGDINYEIEKITPKSRDRIIENDLYNVLPDDIRVSGRCGEVKKTGRTIHENGVETYWVDVDKFIPTGEYRETEVDRHKKQVDFLLQSIDGGWYSIWFNRPTKLKPGRGVKSYDEEGHRYAVTESVLKKLDKQYTSATDF